MTILAIFLTSIIFACVRYRRGAVSRFALWLTIATAIVGSIIPLIAVRMTAESLYP